MIVFMLAALLVQDAEVTETVPPLVTIEQLHRDPDGWNGQPIRMIGYFTECRNSPCQVCDVPDDASEEFT
ncbi:hypothetical protein V0U79_04580 [Hyphobacterium sp. HN65]|uniref:Uncharacterized protein n=1 Tax=Hyphobacterium lacteum TaxID=3116575 RepID=A0ABU7LP06_9PROT|nr:hypothetical protein [Hyphobacterium sp. HN65]MEE2525632.1 hypothetical protein [Hyphobacterium sp. HN65]